ncbi:Inositol 2-dehydrogenase/D-chiro-inositol 3-dehydrogenase [Paenibacillus solanacearum]|uniref:Inositol 2-dehydrogenase/D-chiro-inositol 3-dehydrogenase n=1 Tax=Paenibacillus solanacearum TaxID=2048548 RepID=A0A916JZV1_9BACL|nr:Gfo/Idh/MocA family oxidoreductase [Paenibacillus solanacearum]CAG7610542.1 Inositol 2-dehydrogenase/D-chiro-inositol 3-dehydrogenase [Paenibacillus solanacearum]
MSKKYRVGVIGTGNIFKTAHLKTWLEHPDTEIVALCDVLPDRVQAIAKEANVTDVYTDYREVIRRSDIDLIDICTPNKFHSVISVAALEAGKHVFCEKPDAINPQEAQRMADAAKRSGKLLMVMRNNRFSSAAQYLKRYIDEGHMGEIYTGRCGWIRRRGIPGKGGWFTTKELSGGGPLIDLGVHFIDLSMWLMGNPKPVAVSGAVYTKFAHNELSDSIHSTSGDKQAGGTYDVEDLATGFIRFDNGATLQIEFSWASNIGEEMNFIEFRGTKSGASLKRGELALFSEAAGQLTDIKPQLHKQKAPPQHGENIKHFIDCVAGRAEPIIRPEHGVDMINILCAIYESAECGREVRL